MLKRYRKMCATVILLSFLTIRGFAEPPMGQEMNTTENSTKSFSDTEVAALIEELSKAAEDAIEKAAAEAAKAAALASLEREAALLQEKALALADSQRWRREYESAKAEGFKNSVVTGVICFIAGAVVGGITAGLITR